MATAQVTSVVGARPQFVKLAPMSHAMADAGIRHDIIHTGQHYDDRMSASFFRDLGIAAPNINLDVGSGSHGMQTGAMMGALDEAFVRDRPTAVLVYGDTNTTLAATLAATKLHIPVAHLEAGLRSFDRAMPEEINRVLTDHGSDLLLAPTDLAMRNLDREGLAGRAALVGDVMVDACFYARDKVIAGGVGVPEEVPESDFVFCTLHRPSNVDDPDRLTQILHALRSIPTTVVIAAHPRLLNAAGRLGVRLSTGADNIRVVQPLSYPEMVATLLRAAAVVTDSGGLQKEAFLLRCPCTTVRDTTEWPETLIDGWNILDPACSSFTSGVLRPRPNGAVGHPYGEGNAAKTAIAAMRTAGLIGV